MAPRKASKGETRIARYRRRVGITQQSLADQAGLAVGTIRNLEQQRRAPTKAQLQVFMRCAVVLGCTIEELIEDAWWDVPGKALAPAIPSWMSAAEAAAQLVRCPRCGGATNPAGRLGRERVCVTCGNEFKTLAPATASHPAAKRAA